MGDDLLAEVERNRHWLWRVVAIVVPIVSGIVIPILIWVVPSHDGGCDRQIASIGNLEVQKDVPFRDYLERQGWSQKGLDKKQLQARVDIVSARIDVEKYPSVFVKLAAYRRDSAGRILAGSLVDNPVIEVEFNACETQQRVLGETPTLHGVATYEMSLSDARNEELDRSRAEA